MSLKLLVTEDDSHTVYSAQYGAHYHSVFGALEESIHVFISAGLYHAHQHGKKSVSIFEMGMGTGLNALLTALEAKELNIKVDYTTIESDPIPTERVKELNYHSLLDNDSTQDIQNRIHQSAWDTIVQLTDHFTFHKILGKLEETILTQKFDLIYYDAFAPSCQAYLWTEDIHSKLYDSLSENGVLVTYCTQGAFRRTLESLGYSIERLNGPGRKREMLRATKGHNTKPYK